MSYRVIITETAKDDLREIAFGVADISQSVETARKLVQNLQKECEALREYPMSGAFPKDYILRSAGYRYLIYKGYMIFYEIDEENHIVRIVAFFHEKLDYMKIMRRFM